MKPRFFVLFLILGWLVACRREPEPTPTPSPELLVAPIATNTFDIGPQNTPTVVTDLPQESQVPATPTLLVENPAPFLRSETPISTDTNGLELPRTVLPLPTIPTDEVEAFVLNLIRGNEDCRLPCWWGATPEETTWQETEPFLDTFAEISSMPISGEIAYFVQIYVPNKEDPSIVYGGAYTVRDDVIRSIQTAGRTPNYFLSQLLNDYGQPDEVWLNTYNHTPGGTIPFRLTLVYQEGFVVTYSLQNATKHTESIVGCFDYLAPFLWLVSPNRGITFEEAHQESAQVGIDQFYLPLQEATDLTLLEFYEQFKNPENPACLETPSTLWP